MKGRCHSVVKGKAVVFLCKEPPGVRLKAAQAAEKFSVKQGEGG